jgi:multidrug efflux pump subunit AcrA (membrane-fusion protein)
MAPPCRAHPSASSWSPAAARPGSIPRSGAPAPAEIVAEADPEAFAVDHPEQFPTVAAVAHAATTELAATGVVAIDVTRSVPVAPLTSGRVVAVQARVGDTVAKGQVILKLTSDDNDLELADNVERKAALDVEAKAAHLQLLGSDPRHPSTTVEITTSACRRRRCSTSTIATGST